jgi:hypothetical protein
MIKKLDFVVLGGAKCGTTSLYDMLSAVDDVELPIKKDFHFFDDDKNYNLGLDWYFEHFKDNKKKTCGEVAANYLYSEKAVKRILENFPEIKIVIILRHPIDRLLSEYKYHFSHQTISLTLDECLDKSINKNVNGEQLWDLLVGRSEYSKWIELLHKYNSEKNILILKTNELNDVERLSTKLADFLNLPSLKINSQVHSNIAKPAKFRIINKIIKSNSFIKRILRLIIASPKVRRKMRDKLRIWNSKNTNEIITEAAVNRASVILSEEIIYFKGLENEK